MIYLGVDTGKEGGIVMLDPMGVIVGTWLMPVIRAGNKTLSRGPRKGKTIKAGRDRFDLPGIHALFAKIVVVDARGVASDVRAAVELVTPMPLAYGTTTTFFGQGYGLALIEMALTSLGIPYDLMSAQKWQGVMLTGAGTEDRKAASVVIAQRKWPKQDWRRSEKARKAHDGLTDAALIAEYGRRQFIGEGIAVQR